MLAGHPVWRIGGVPPRQTETLKSVSLVPDCGLLRDMPSGSGYHWTKGFRASHLSHHLQWSQFCTFIHQHACRQHSGMSEPGSGSLRPDPSRQVSQNQRVRRGRMIQTGCLLEFELNRFKLFGVSLAPMPSCACRGGNHSHRREWAHSKPHPGAVHVDQPPLQLRGKPISQVLP